MNKTITPPKTLDMQNNAIGLTEMKSFVKDAHNALDKAKAQEAAKIQLGYKWMRLGNTVLLVNPSRIPEYIGKGYKRISPLS